MAIFTVSAGTSYKRASGTTTATSFDYTADAQIETSPTIPVSSTAYEVDIAFPYATLKTLFLYSKTQALTVKTNSSGSPDDTIALAAGVPVVYTYDGRVGTSTNPLAHNVTKLYVVNASTTIAPDLQIHALYDATPA